MTEFNAARDEVLFAFQLAHPRPAPADVAEWVRRHPEHRAAIMEHTALLLETAVGGDEAVEVPDDMLARGRSFTLGLLHRARQGDAEVVPQQPAGTTLRDLLEASGRTLPDVAREIGAGRGMLTEIVSGRAWPPIRKRLKAAFAGAVGASLAAFDAALEGTLASPVAARTKADDGAVARRRSYDEVVATDPTTPDERKAYWLAAD